MRETPLFKQCPNCQQFSPEESDVCLQCGHNFTPVQAPTETSGPGGSEGLPGQPPEMPEEQASKKTSSGLQKLALGALVIVVGGSVLLCVIGLTVAALLDDSPDSSTLERPTYTPVPTFTSTPVGSTVTETTGQSDTQIQAQPTETLAPSRPVSSTPVPSTATLVPPTPVPPTATPTPKPIVTINNDMNVRGGPGTNYPIIGTASPGQQFPIAGKNPAGDWWKINYNGQAGWVFGQLVTATNAKHAQMAAIIPAPPSTPKPTSTPRPRPTRTRRPAPTATTATIRTTVDSWRVRYSGIVPPFYNIDWDTVDLFRGVAIIGMGKVVRQAAWVEVTTGRRVGTVLLIEIDGPLTESGGDNFGHVDAVVLEIVDLDDKRIAFVSSVVRMQEGEGIFDFDKPLLRVFEYEVFE